MVVRLTFCSRRLRNTCRSRWGDEICRHCIQLGVVVEL